MAVDLNDVCPLGEPQDQTATPGAVAMKRGYVVSLGLGQHGEFKEYCLVFVITMLCRDPESIYVSLPQSILLTILLHVYNICGVWTTRACPSSLLPQDIDLPSLHNYGH